MVRTVLAVLVAAALIAGALVVRTQLIEGDDEPAAGDPSTVAATPSAAPAGDGGDGVRIACDRVVADACRSLEGATATVLPLGDLLTAFAGTAAAPYDAVVAPGFVVGMLTAGSGAPDLGEPELVATTPLVAAVYSARDAAVVEACGGSVDWGCLAEQGPAGGVSLGFADPLTSSAGLAALGGLAVGFFGGPDFATNDFSGRFTGWVRDLGDASERSGDPLAAMLQFNGARIDTAIVPAVDHDRLVASTPRTPPVRHDPAPAITLGIVVAPVAVDGDVGEVAAALADALQEQGYAAPSAAQPGGLPSPGVMLGLRQQWEEFG